MEHETYELQRTDNICPTPEMQLVEYVKLNSESEIRNLIAKNSDVLNTIIGHPYYKPILHIACDDFADRILPQTVELLIELGADLYYSEESHRHKEALHYAALGQNPRVLQVILNRIKTEKVNSLCVGDNTALNLLIQEGDPNKANLVECVCILIEAGIDVNKSDARNSTPIFWAAKNGYKDVVQAILNECGQEADIDSHKQRGKSARDYIVENNLSNLNDVYENVSSREPANNNRNNNSSDFLFECLEDFNEDAFVNYKQLAYFVDSDNGIETLLQMATRRGFSRAVESLLNNGANPNRITHKTKSPPVEIAVVEGCHEILDKLLKHDRIEKTHSSVNYDLCYKLLMKHKDLDVNATNIENGNTPLHYAAQCGDAEKTLDLLRCGASMACKNRYGSLPVEDIDANTLKTHLNECLETNVDSNIDRESFTATFNYRTLMPPPRFRNQYFWKNDTEAAIRLIANELEHLESEIQVISFMSKSPELNHLLKHPIITSFLYIKWHRIRWFFYINLGFYIMFCSSLILYILLIYGNSSDQQNKVVAYVLSVLLSITFALLVFRELFQIAVSPSTYFLNFENLLELLLISLTAFILFQGSSSEETKKQVAAVAVLLAAFEMVLLIGQHPKMSTNIGMFQTVSVNFFKFLLWYLIFIIAFSLSFYILFKNNEVEEGDSRNSTNRTDGDDEEQNFFINPGLSFFKTIVMLTGEFDASSINFQFSISYIIFILFIFMIPIILVNLLNGLAISDIQHIKSDAELVGHKARMEYIAYIESMLLENGLLTRVVNCLLPINIRSWFVKKIFLFPYFLHDYKITFFLNLHVKVVLISDEYSDLEVCVPYLDKETVRCTKQLITSKRKELDKAKNVQTVFMKQQQVIEQQQKYIEELTKQQQVILNKLDYIITNRSVTVQD